MAHGLFATEVIRMGLIASMTVVPAAVFRRGKGDLANLEVPAKAATFRLDKAWVELHAALRQLPKPLPMAIAGDHPVGTRLDDGLLGGCDDDSDEEENYEDVEDCYVGYASPSLVKKVDPALRQLSDAELLAAIGAAGWANVKKAEQRYCLATFAELKKAYSRAGAEGAALMILIG